MDTVLARKSSVLPHLLSVLAMRTPALRRLGCYPYQVAVFRMPFMHSVNFSPVADFCDVLDR